MLYVQVVRLPFFKSGHHLFTAGLSTVYSFTKRRNKSGFSGLNKIPIKEMPRRRINPKNWLQNKLWHKIPKKGILSSTKVKLRVGGLYSFIPFFLLLIEYVFVVNWICYFCYLKFNVFNNHKEKYAKPDFIKFISREIKYFVGTGCFVFKKYRHASLSGTKSKLLFPLFLSPLFLHISLSLCVVWQLLLDF